jgi:hypothetical protein
MRSDGRREVDNVEVTTVHYRGMHAPGKSRQASPDSADLPGGSGLSTHGASSPFDQQAADELLR